MMFLHCKHCVERSLRGAYEIAVTPTGDLRLICKAHELHNAGPFYVFKNENIADELRELGMSACDCHEEEKH